MLAAFSGHTRRRLGLCPFSPVIVESDFTPRTVSLLFSSPLFLTSLNRVHVHVVRKSESATWSAAGWWSLFPGPDFPVFLQRMPWSVHLGNCPVTSPYDQWIIYLLQQDALPPNLVA